MKHMRPCLEFQLCEIDKTVDYRSSKVSSSVHVFFVLVDKILNAKVRSKNIGHNFKVCVISKIKCNPFWPW